MSRAVSCAIFFTALSPPAAGFSLFRSVRFITLIGVFLVMMTYFIFPLAVCIKFLTVAFLNVFYPSEFKFFEFPTGLSAFGDIFACKHDAIHALTLKQTTFAEPH